MALSDENRKSKFERLRESLYDRYADIRPKPRTPFYARNNPVSTGWEQNQQQYESMVRNQHKPSLHEKALRWSQMLFLGSIIFFVGILLFAGGKFLFKSALFSPKDVEVEILAQPFVDGGETIPVTIQISNHNQVPLETVDVIFEYATTSVEGGQKSRERVSLQNIRAGGTVFQDFSIALFGEEGEERTLNASVEYRMQGSNAILVKQATVPITIRSTPLEVVFEGRDTAIPQQNYVFDIVVQTNTTDVLQDIVVNAEYPEGFRFVSAEPAPTFDIDTWVLGDINPATTTVIHVEGTLEGEAGDGKMFRIFVGNQDPRQEQNVGTIFGSQAHQVVLNPSFLRTNIMVQGKTGNRLVIPATQKTTVQIEWENTLPLQLRNVVFRGEFSGNAYTNIGVTGGDGFFNSNTNVITWDGTTKDALTTLDPGERGTLKFDIQPRALANSQGVIITQPNINFIIRAQAIDSLGQVQDLETVAQTQFIVNSDIRLESKTLHAGGPFSHMGQVPPKVGEKTEFTLAWALTNSSNMVQNTRISTRLPAYVEWLGITSPAQESLEYNPLTRELVWDIGNLTAGTGFNSTPREVFFKIALTPSETQRGNVPELTESLVLEGQDTYTNGTLRIVKNPHTTRLLNDIILNNGVIE